MRLFFIASALSALLWMAIASASTTPQRATHSFQQYTSRGHLVRFDERGYYVSNGSYALHVTCEHARTVAPSSPDGHSGQAAALGRVSYSGLWDGISVTYDAPPSGIARSTWT